MDAAARTVLAGFVGFGAFARFDARGARLPALTDFAASSFLTVLVGFAADFFFTTLAAVLAVLAFLGVFFAIFHPLIPATIQQGRGQYFWID
jgi:hypothetical protein